MADLLTIWTRVYALHQAMFQKRYWNHGASGPHGDDFELFGLAFILPAFCMPKLPAALAAHLFYVVLKCWRCPFQCAAWEAHTPHRSKLPAVPFTGTTLTSGAPSSTWVSASPRCEWPGACTCGRAARCPCR